MVGKCRKNDGKTGEHQDGCGGLAVCHRGQQWVLGGGLGRNGHIAIGSPVTLQGWLGMSVRRREERTVSSEFSACEWTFERRGQR